MFNYISGMSSQNLMQIAGRGLHKNMLNNGEKRQLFVMFNYISGMSSQNLMQIAGT